MPSLNLNISQKMNLTPELQQAIRLMNLSLHELEQEVRDTLNENFLLEENLDVKSSPIWEGTKKILSSSSASIDSVVDFEYLPSKIEYLMQQVEMLSSPQKNPELLESLIDALNDNGYLIEGNISNIEQYSQDEIDSNIRLLQSLEPSGIGGRNLKEVLSIQAREVGMLNNSVKCVIDNIEHLDEVNIQKMGISQSEFDTAVLYVKTLEPKPGRIFGETGKEIIIDAVVDFKSPEILISVNSGFVPDLKVNTDYEAYIDSMSGDEQETMKEHLIAAKSFIRNINNRNDTLQKVLAEIMSIQKDFLLHGVDHIKPLTMSDVSEACGFHQSTISRIAAKKHVKTPHGVFPVRFFFASSIEGDENALSSNSIKNMIKKMIVNESIHKPLTDQQIGVELSKLGIKISRRTISKYRLALKIPSARERKVK